MEDINEWDWARKRDVKGTNVPDDAISPLSDDI